MNTECDLEQCETCKQLTLAGNDRNGQCVTCAGDDSLTHLLRLMSAGVTRDAFVLDLIEQGYSYAEIATSLQVKPDSVRTIVLRARRRAGIAPRTIEVPE
jgi:ATP/maltotriose-dependent transcriptional regulator MalT